MRSHTAPASFGSDACNPRCVDDPTGSSNSAYTSEGSPSSTLQLVYAHGFPIQPTALAPRAHEQIKSRYSVS